MPVHVRCLIDECANIGQIPNLSLIHIFNELVLSDKLFEHCAEIDEAARNRMELIVPELSLIHI